MSKTTPAAAIAPPEQVVRQYYQALASGDAAAASALETPQWRQELSDSDNHDVSRISVENLEIGPFERVEADGTRPDYLKSYAEIREAFVKYDLLEDTRFEDAGRTGRYVIVARVTPSSPWRVDGTGTGP